MDSPPPPPSFSFRYSLVLTPYAYDPNIRVKASFLLLSLRKKKECRLSPFFSCGRDSPKTSPPPPPLVDFSICSAFALFPFPPPRRIICMKNGPFTLFSSFLPSEDFPLKSPFFSRESFCKPLYPPFSFSRMKRMGIFFPASEKSPPPLFKWK